MKKLALPHDEYIRSLPRKRMGASILLFDEQGRILIVKPNYREGWQTPGGVVDQNESPLQAAIRETKEEVGLEITQMEFLLVAYVSTHGEEGSEGLEFMFSGGTLTDKQVLNIKIENEELEEYKFVDLDEAYSLFRLSVKNRVKATIEAMQIGGSKYVEFRKYENF